jgi:uracil-DNA glycosylase family 4
MKYNTKKDKLVALQEMLNLETGELNTDFFEYENTLYEKAVQMKALAARIRACSLCPGMNIKRSTEACPGWGDLNAKVFFIGQSLHQPGVVSDLPFILGCGYILDAALRLSGLLRKDVFITNTVHCHPPRNRGTTDEEKNNCWPFLKEELNIVRPKLVVALGNDAKQATQNIANWLGPLYDEPDARFPFKMLCVKHPASFMYSAPEERVGWILRLSKEIDKVYKDV